MPKNVTAGNLLVVVLEGVQFIPSSVSVSDSQGNTYQAADSMYTDPRWSGWSQVFWATAKSSGANTVTATFSSATYPGIALYEVTSSGGGTWSVAGKQSTHSGNGTGTLTVGSVTTTTASSFILSYITSANGAVTGGTGWTYTPGVNYVLGSIEAGTEYQIGPAATYTGTFNDSMANGFAGGVVAFQVGGGSGGNAAVPMVDYARCLAFWSGTPNPPSQGGCNDAGQTSTQQQTAYQFLTPKLQVREDNPTVTLLNGTTVKQTARLYNPTIKFWAYGLLYTCLQNNGAALVGCTWVNGQTTIVEDDYLHTGSPHSIANRLTTTIFSSARYWWNYHSSSTMAKLQTIYANQMAAFADDYLWFDELGLITRSLGSTAVDEYGGANGSALEAGYSSDVATYLTDLRATLNSAGRGLIVNTGQDGVCDGAANNCAGGANIAGEVTAANGFVIELTWRATDAFPSWFGKLVGAHSEYQ